MGAIEGCSGARRLGDREGVAVGILKIGDLGVALEGGDAPPLGLQLRLVVALEDHAPAGKLLDYPLDALDTPAGQGRRGLAGVLRGEVNAEQAVFGAAVLHEAGRVDGRSEAELALVEVRGPAHVRNRESCAPLVVAQDHLGLPPSRLRRRYRYRVPIIPTASCIAPPNFRDRPCQPL